MAVPISERIPNNQEDMYRSMFDAFSSNLRVAMPGIIQSFDPVEQTVTVQPAIRERVQDGKLQSSWVNLPLLLDVPIVLPRAGNMVMTMPIAAGDECLVIFADMCYDAFFSNGGIQNQIEKRRHDLSDGIAIIGMWSQPNVIENYSTTSAQLRNLNGTQYVEISDNAVNLVGNVRVNGNPL
ncbi:hypothetical protein SAMN04487969_102493 [Paenibacillus algorifonticola]|uniref:Phage protein Gp138 N-terminal domain-containing protein n=1 Tax=Paenibacillus algorifonticola TaxID=684063 RepID=A0A1I2AGY6_9BACL|nr:Gp138 family membrane-puncturing spike protein [Paenibacillus algorifonticola]SFE43284.1 hypothetical protein SAMN04487969_102493 [Paenibacillus algorifonticola]